jgi:hypothetical protein
LKIHCRAFGLPSFAFRASRSLHRSFAKQFLAIKETEKIKTKAANTVAKINSHTLHFLLKRYKFWFVS